MNAYYINIGNINYDDNIDFLLNFVDETKRKKVLKFVHKDDRIRTLIGDILVRVYICKNYNYKNNKIKYIYNKFSKPSIESESKINFNISHSGNYVAAAFDDEEVGIDVEEVKEIKYEEIIKNFFAKSENLWIQSVNKSERIREFFKLWTLKESYVKYKGKGLNIPFDSFAININKKNNICTLENNKENVFFKNYDLNENCQLSLCSHKKEGFIKALTYEELVKIINKYLN